MKRKSVILFTLFVILWSSGRAGSTDTTGRSDIYKMLDRIQEVMRGAPFEKVQQYVSPEAMVVTGDSIRQLVDVLKGKARAEVLREDSTRNGVQVTARSNDAEDAIYVILKTVSARKDDPHYHSLVLYKQPSTGWQIYLWHVGR